MQKVYTTQTRTQLPYSLNQTFLVRVILLYLFILSFSILGAPECRLPHIPFLHNRGWTDIFCFIYSNGVGYRWGVDDTGYGIVWYGLGCVALGV